MNEIAVTPIPIHEKVRPSLYRTIRQMEKHREMNNFFSHEEDRIIKCQCGNVHCDRYINNDDAMLVPWRKLTCKVHPECFERLKKNRHLKK